MMEDYKMQYLNIVDHLYGNVSLLQQEIIKLEAIVSLPKGTEHFMSDLHGEYPAFKHLINNCSGVIREKISLCFPNLDKTKQDFLATLIYYPEEKLALIKDKDYKWYFNILIYLVKLTSLISSKYSRGYVKNVIKEEYCYVIDELLHTKDNSETNIKEYFSTIIKAIIKTNSQDDYIIELSRLIKRLAVSRLHIAGDIFDRGNKPDHIIELLKQHHSLDIEWGNHDILWFGAYSGNPLMVLYVIYNTVKYDNISVLENAYGISLHKLLNYAKLLYGNENNVISPLIKTTLILLTKLEGNLVKNYPNYFPLDRLVLNNIDFNDFTYQYNGEKYPLKDKTIKGLDYNDPYMISNIELDIIESLVLNFKSSPRLKEHLKFMLDKGSTYLIYNDNLIYHGCIPLDEDGQFKEVLTPKGKLKGKLLFDYIDDLLRRAVNFKVSEEELDFIYYLWNGFDSPFTGRWYKTFELAFLDNKELQKEERNPYYTYRDNYDVCLNILKEFNINKNGHIINGHLPVKVKSGESPIKANGKLIIIDGGFCQAYHQKTGIAGYTLISNSHGLRIKAHDEFCGINEVLENDKDIISNSKIIETYRKRLTIKDTTEGKKLEIMLNGLKEVLKEKK